MEGSTRPSKIEVLHLGVTIRRFALETVRALRNPAPETFTPTGKSIERLRSYKLPDQVAHLFREGSIQRCCRDIYLVLLVNDPTIKLDVLILLEGSGQRPHVQESLYLM